MIRIKKTRILSVPVVLAMSVPMLALSVPAAQASTSGGIASFASGQVGDGPCGGSNGYYATGTGQSTSCSDGGEAHGWCADFAGWVWQQAGVTVDGNLNNWAYSFEQYGQAHGTWS